MLETKAKQVSCPLGLVRTSRGWSDSHSRRQAQLERQPRMGLESGSKKSVGCRDKTTKALMGTTGLWGHDPEVNYVL